jgi:hypothetical protein
MICCEGESEGGEGTVLGGCFTDVLLHSSISYHQEHALPTTTEPHRLHKDDQAACGAVILRFHGDSNL